MSSYDKSTIQRMLGIIKGVAMVLDKKYAEPLLNAVSVIDETLKKKENALMTASEAHTYLEDLQRGLTRNRNGYPQEIIEANGVAILALEKQIPKKPIKKNPICYEKTKDGTEFIAYDYFCPDCKKQIKVTEHHCKCGQALDWSDTE